MSQILNYSNFELFSCYCKVSNCGLSLILEVEHRQYKVILKIAIIDF